MKPTVGRVVHYWPDADHFVKLAERATIPRHNQPLAALITHVVSETEVHLSVFNEFGVPFSRMHVKLNPTDEALPGECEWPGIVLPSAAPKVGEMVMYAAAQDEVPTTEEKLVEVRHFSKPVGENANA